MPPSSDAAWRRIVSDIAAAITSDRWKVGDAIPSNRDLAVEFDASGTTVTRAVKHLRDVGVLRGQQGVAVVVARRPTAEDVESSAPPADLRALAAEHGRRLAELEAWRREHERRHP